MLPEEEATYLSIVFEEVGAYQYKKNKEMESQTSGGGRGPEGSPHNTGLKAGFEETWSFGEDDDTDYWHFKDDGVEIVD